MSRLQYLRKKYDFTQTQVQMKIGIDQSDYSKIETDASHLTYAQCRELAILFHTSMDYLAELTDEEKPHSREKRNLYEHFNRLKCLRKKYNITQEEIAKASGLSQSNYSKIEREKRHFNYTQCKTFAIQLHTSMDYLAELTDDKSSYPKSLNNKQ